MATFSRFVLNAGPVLNKEVIKRFAVEICKFREKKYSRK